MDLVDWDQATFDAIAAEVRGLAEVDAILPISAKLGDNVVDASDAAPWYDGPPLLELLEEIEVDDEPDAAAGHLVGLRIALEQPGGEVAQQECADDVDDERRPWPAARVGRRKCFQRGKPNGSAYDAVLRGAEWGHRRLYASCFRPLPVPISKHRAYHIDKDCNKCPGFVLLKHVA